MEFHKIKKQYENWILKFCYHSELSTRYQTKIKLISACGFFMNMWGLPVNTDGNKYRGKF